MSTIKVDTIQKANGTSQIGIDKIGGVASAGTIAVIAEGGTNTTNLAQGLAKVWVNFDGDASGATARDSFNVASTDDDGTGDYGVNFTSSMSNNDYAMTGSASLSAHDNNDVGLIGPSRTNAAESLATGSVQLDGQKSSNTAGNARDLDAALIAIHGDLA